jgi:hypothetical protein
VGAEPNVADIAPADVTPQRREAGAERPAGSHATVPGSQPVAQPQGNLVELQRLAGNRAVSELIGGAGTPLVQPRRSTRDRSFDHEVQASLSVQRRFVLLPYPHFEDDEAPEGGGSEKEGWAKRQRGGLNAAQKSRLNAGAIIPISRTLPLIGSKDPGELAASLAGVPGLVGGITVADAEVQDTIIQASNDVSTGRNALLSSIDPAGAMIAATTQLATVGTTLDGMIAAGNQTATAPKPAEGGAPPAGPGGAPAGPAAPGGAPAGPAAPTPGEIEQVKGIRQGVTFVQGELAKPLPDFELVESRIGELATTAQTFQDSPALAAPLAKAGRQLEGVNNLIIGAKGGKELSLDLARGRLSSAVALMSGMAGVSGGPGEQPAGAEGPGAP